MIKIILVMMTMLLLISTGAAAPSVSVMPSSVDVMVGDAVSVDIYVDPENNEVYAAQFYLIYTASKLSATGIEKGPLLTQDGASAFVMKGCNNGVNECIYIETRIGDIPGISTPGTLATITFRADVSGVVALDLSNVRLLDPLAKDIENIAIYSGTVNIMQPPDPLIPATIDIDPDTLNLKSNGEWITAYIELPGHDIGEIDVSTINLLSDSEETFLVDPDTSVAVADHDSDGVPDLMVKFDRATVSGYLGYMDVEGDGTGTDHEVILTIKGELIDGTLFEGTDTIRVIDKAK